MDRSLWYLNLEKYEEYPYCRQACRSLRASSTESHLGAGLSVAFYHMENVYYYRSMDLDNDILGMCEGNNIIVFIHGSHSM